MAKEESHVTRSSFCPRLFVLVPPYRDRRCLNSMTGTTWTLPSQAAFLAERYHDYLAHKTSGDLRVFWATVTSSFFVQWPSQEAEVAEALSLPASSDSKSKKSKSKSTRLLYESHTEWSNARKAVSPTFRNRVSEPN